MILLALIIVPIVTIYEIGDWVPITMHMNQIAPSCLDVFKDMSLLKMGTGVFWNA